jgi:hypothetical protein
VSTLDLSRADTSVCPYLSGAYEGQGLKPWKRPGPEGATPEPETGGEGEGEGINKRGKSQKRKNIKNKPDTLFTLRYH